MELKQTIDLDLVAKTLADITKAPPGYRPDSTCQFVVSDN